MTFHSPTPTDLERLDRSIARLKGVGLNTNAQRDDLLSIDHNTPPTYDPVEMARLFWRDHKLFVVRLALLSPAQLARQAAAHIDYLRGYSNTDLTEAHLLRVWRRMAAAYLSQSGAATNGAIVFSAVGCDRNAAPAAGDPGDNDAVSQVLFELSTTDAPTLCDFLREHSVEQRTRMAWHYASWLRREHGVGRSPDFILGNWTKLIE
jgi:hypothetical protein